MSQQGNQAKKGSRKEREHFRNFIQDAVSNKDDHPHYGSEYTSTQYMRSGGPSRSLKRSIKQATRRIEWQAKRAAINEQKRFAHTQARTAQRMKAAEHIYPLI